MAPRWLAILCVFLACFGLYLAAPVMQVGDSQYSLATSMSLLERGSLRIDPYLQRKAPKDWGYYVSNGEDYQVEVVGESMYHFFPLLPAILATPLVWVAKNTGTNLVDVNGRWDLVAEEGVQKWIAAFLVALSVAFAFLTFSVVASQAISVVVAFGIALGSQYYSSLSRAMWSDTWGCLLASVLIWHLVRRGARSALPNSFVVGCLMVGLFACKPQLAIIIIPVYVCLAVQHASQGISLFIIGLVGFSFFALMSLWVYGSSMPAYYLAGRLSSHGFWPRFAGAFVSPSRGTLIFMPSVVVAVYLSIRYWRWLPVRHMVVLGGVVMMGVHVLIGLFSHWWGGYSYGPRLSSAVVPWLGVVLACCMAGQSSAFRAGFASPRVLMAERCVAALAIALSIMLNLPGAWSRSAIDWNGKPASVDLHPERLWDWENPQFMTPLRDCAVEVGPASSYFPIGCKIEAGDPKAGAAFGAGWSAPDVRGRLAGEGKAVIYLPAEPGETLYLRMALAPIPAQGQGPVSVSITLRDVEIVRHRFSHLGFSVLPLTVPGRLVSSVNDLVLHVDLGHAAENGVSNPDVFSGGVLLGWVSRD